MYVCVCRERKKILKELSVFYGLYLKPCTCLTVFSVPNNAICFSIFDSHVNPSLSHKFLLELCCL